MSSRIFGFLRDGRVVEAWTLCGSGGLVLEVITYGATVTRLFAPDREGRLADVVLGFNNLESYLVNSAYVGAVAGRVAGRLTGGKFTLEGNTHQLVRNHGPNHLHGGLSGFDKRVWIAEPVERGVGPSLRLSHCSPDGDEGYPGAVGVTAIYTVSPDNVLRFETEAITDRPTPFTLTQHSYFNLAGESSGRIADHELQISADEFLVVDEHMTLLGKLKSVAGRGNDFRESRSIGDALPHLFQNHGDLYRIRRANSEGAGKKLAPAARLQHAGSGRLLEVSTTENYLQFYTGAGFDGSIAGKSGVPYGRYAGLCLECHGYPDGPNAPWIDDIILRPGSPHRGVTTYAFSTI